MRKTHMRSIIAICIAIILMNCDKTEPIVGESKTLSVDVSECKANKSAGLMINEYIEKISVEAIGDDNYRISHENTIFNCCLSEGLEVTVSLKEDTIFLSESEKVPGICDCICPYDVVTEFGPVAEGSYVLCIMMGGYNHFTFPIDLDESTSLQENI